MAYTREQKKVLSEIIRVGRKKGAKRSELISAIATALVESGARNLSYGDRDSVGWRQERSHYGSVKNRMNVRNGAIRYFNEIKSTRGSGMTPGQKSQAVQRSAFPDRYDTMAGQAKDILKSSLGKNAGPKTARFTPKRSRLTGKLETIQGASYAADRKALKQQTLMSAAAQGRMPSQDELLNMKGGLSELEDENDQQILNLKRKVTGGKRIRGKGAQAKGGSDTNMKRIVGKAKQLGLHVGEYGGVTGGHAPNSYHYQTSKAGGGAAADISGDPKAMAKFARYLAKRKRKDLEELIYRGPGSRNYMNIKKGKRVGKGFYTAHEDHVHVADTD